MSQLHSGHRKRLRKRLEQEGIDAFAPHEVLEVLLYSVIARGDTNPIAHRLMAHFGSISAVFEASEAELMKVDGIGQKSAQLISLIPHLSRRYMVDKNTTGMVLDSPEKLGEFIKPYFVGVNNEQFYIISLDRKRKLLSCRMLSEGTLGKVSIDMRQVVEVALNTSASLVVLAHNHTHGFALPSNDDINVTNQIAKALKMISVDVIDHIIVAREDYISFSQSGLLLK